MGFNIYQSYDQPIVNYISRNQSPAWDPKKTLQIINPDRSCITCVGYAPSCGRRCRNPINAGNRASAEEILKEISFADLKDSNLRSQLSKLAGYTLCLRYHQDQVDSVVRKWEKQIQVMMAKPLSNIKQEPGLSSCNFSEAWFQDQIQARVAYEVQQREKAYALREEILRRREAEVQWERQQQEFKKQKREQRKRERQDQERRERECQEREQRQREDEEERARLVREQEKREWEERERQQREAEEKKRAKEQNEQEEKARKQRWEEAKQKREKEAAAKAEKEKAEWDTIWRNYVAKWDDLQRGHQPVRRSPRHLMTTIPWPVKSGKSADVNAAEIRKFFRMAPPAGLDITAKIQVLSTECRKWHEDKIRKLTGGSDPDKELLEVFNLVAGVVVVSRRELVDKRKKGR